MKTNKTLLLLAYGMMLGACGGDDSNNGDAATDATQGNDVTTPSDGGGDDSSPKSDACVPIEGGLACDGLHIACGNLECEAGAQVCSSTTAARRRRARCPR